MARSYCWHCMQETGDAQCPHCGHDTAVTNDTHQLSPGTLIRDRFLVGRVLGQGGFGITYIGRDLESDTIVAVKEFFPASTVNRDISQSNSVRVNTEDMTPQFMASRERFLREAEALQRLEDVAEIVDILGCFEENNTAYIVMEYIRGSDLRRYVEIRGGKLSVSEALKLLEPVILALGTVHKKGLVHRDISPDNIMLHPLGGAKLLDFGAVRNVDNPDAEKDLTHSTEAILKHGFAPLEQYWSRGSLGPWTDLYAMGATIYYCVTGQVPPNAPARSMDEEQLQWDLAPELTGDQRAVLEKAMALRAPDRFSTMEAFYDALYKGQGIPVEKAPEAPPAHKRKRGRLLPVAAGLVICAAAAAYFLLPGKNAQMQTPPESTSQPTAEAAVSVVVTTVPSTEAPTEPSTQVTTEPTTEPTTVPTEPPTERQPEPWEGNVLMSKPWSKLDMQAERIQTVTFYSSLENAPATAVDVSVSQDGSVLMWREMYNVFIGAEGGINAVSCCPTLFCDLADLNTVKFGSAFHTDYATSMAGMFQRCCKLVSVDVQNLNTANVINMKNMFRMEHKDTYTYYEPGQVKGGNLDRLDVSGWDTSKVQNMSGMFYGCEYIRSLDVSAWDTGSVTDMQSMFYGCTALQEPDVQFWDVSSVTNMEYMFYNCTSLSELWVDDWNTQKLNRVDYMFYNCQSLERLEMSDWYTAKLSSTRYMFAQSGLEYVGASGWDTGNLRNTEGMFQCCYALKDLDVSNWDMGNVTVAGQMFLSCSSLVKINVSAWDVSSLSDGSHMFSYCENLKTLDVSAWNVSRLRNAEYMFYNCLKLEDFDITRWDTKGIQRYTRFLNDGTYVQGQFWTNFFPKS